MTLPALAGQLRDGAAAAEHLVVGVRDDDQDVARRQRREAVNGVVDLGRKGAGGTSRW